MLTIWNKVKNLHSLISAPVFLKVWFSFCNFFFLYTKDGHKDEDTEYKSEITNYTV